MVCISTFHNHVVYHFQFQVNFKLIADVENNQTKWSVKDALPHEDDDRVGEQTEALVSKNQDMKFGVSFDMDTN